MKKGDKVIIIYLNHTYEGIIASSVLYSVRYLCSNRIKVQLKNGSFFYPLIDFVHKIGGKYNGKGYNS